MEGSQRSEATPRRSAELEVDCATEEMSAPVTLTTKDVGAGGLFIKTEYPLEMGTRFGTRFDLGDGRPILAECEVAWVRTGPPEAVPPPGMGVRFSALDAADAQRLQCWITGAPCEEGAEAPRVTFRIEGLGQTVPGEFRASSEDGMSAVAELPFLKIGSAVQVTVDEPGGASPRAGRIAWLVMEENEDDEAGAPRVRIGIHFDPGAEAALAASVPRGTPSQPIPLTLKKSDVPAGVTTSLTLGVPEPATSAGGQVATPWELGGPADTAPARAAATRRRVRSRQGKGRLDVGQAWQTLRSHAARSPRIAFGAMGLAILLLIGVVSAIALSGGRKPAQAAKAKATPTASAPAGDPAADPAAAPLPARPAAAAPSAPKGAAPGAAASDGAPPALPGDAAGGRAALASGPGVNADPDKVLADAKGGREPDAELKDPRTDPEAAPKIHIYSLGRKLVVKLPTKGKPKSVKHYLLANPDGVVVDAAGAAAVLRPGRYAVKDPRVKFVKVLHRGKAARFIVYYGKGVKSPKMRLMPTDDGVSFVITTGRGAPEPRVAKRPAGRKAGASARKGGAAPKGALTKRPRAAKAPMAARKLQAAPRKQTTRKRPAPKRRPAPIADAEE